MKKLNENNRLPYSLIGVDGNAFSVMAYVRRAMRENGYSKEALETYSGEAMSGDYNNLLALSVAAIDKINRENGFGNEAQYEKDDDNADEYVDYERGIHNRREKIINESSEPNTDIVTLRRTLVKYIVKGIAHYKNEGLDCSIQDVLKVLHTIGDDTLVAHCSLQDVDILLESEEVPHIVLREELMKVGSL